MRGVERFQGAKNYLTLEGTGVEGTRRSSRLGRGWRWNEERGCALVCGSECCV